MTADNKSTRKGQARKAKDRAKRVGLKLQGSLREGLVFVLLAICVFLLLALFSYDPADPGWSHTSPEGSISNWMGSIGAWMADVLYSLFGASALWWPAIFGYASWWMMRTRQERLEWNPAKLSLRCAGLALVLMGTTMFGALLFPISESSLNYGSGGVIGEGLVSALSPLLSRGISLLALAAILCGVPLLTGHPWLLVIDELGRYGLCAWDWASSRIASRRDASLTGSAASASGTSEVHSSWWRRGGGSGSATSIEPEASTSADPLFTDASVDTVPGEPAIGGTDTRIPWAAATAAPLAKRSQYDEPVSPDSRSEIRADEEGDAETLGKPRAFSAVDPAMDKPDTEPVSLSHADPLRSAKERKEPRVSFDVPAADSAPDPVARPAAEPGPEPEPEPEREPEVSAEHPLALSARDEPERRSPESVPEPVLPDDGGPLLSASHTVSTPDPSPKGPLQAPGQEAQSTSQTSSQQPLQASPQVSSPSDGASVAAGITMAAAGAGATAAVMSESRSGSGGEPLAAADSSAGADPEAPAKTQPQAQPADHPEKAQPEGQPATADQAHSAAAEEATKLWTVEHLQSQRPNAESDDVPEGELPDYRLLTEPSAHEPNYTDEQLVEMAELLEVRLREYGVKAEVVDTWPGPVITRFEIKPAAGVKASKISNLAKDLARSLMVKSVRVVEVIPGRPTVGIEIPNPNRAMIRLREVIDSDRFQKETSALTLALGQDIGGGPVVANLGKMPHLLVAGTTGSGKSVGVNAMLISMLLKATPDELRMIMVDPKMLELSVYDGIPHLLAPVVTDMKEAANGLRWCVAEMERRYKLMASMGVRNIAGFNERLDEASEAGAQVADPLWEPQPWEMHQPPPVLEKLPYIVVVIDEFADMFMIVGKKVEELIARLAQKARAAGIHLILATQRPSVDVVTGLIKANIPTRMAFQVSSRVDSRTILDQGGAENLLGHGDMLYLPAGSGAPTRVHGAFVDDDEVHRVVDDWKRRGEPQYIDEILSGGVTADALAGLEADGAEGDDAEQDALYDEAVAFVTESQRASISAVQRRFKIGYNRAARLVDAMEAAGVVSPMGTNGAREVLARSHGA